MYLLTSRQTISKLSLLQVYDPDFYCYLKSQQADDLLFCYRWLLLEMKREFAFDDALRMLEVSWASLPQKTSSVELALKEREFDPGAELDEDPPPVSPLLKAPRENAYTKMCAIRRQSSSFNLSKTPKLATCKQMNHSLDEGATRNVTASFERSKEFQSLDDATLQQKSKLDRNEIDKKDCLLNRESKSLKRKSMKSVPEHGKSPEAEGLATAWASTGNLMNGTTHSDAKNTPLGNQVRQLRDRISVHNNKFFSSLDKLDDSVNAAGDSAKPKVKMIKNLNEFLNFATASKVGAVTQEKLQRTRSVIERSTTKDFPRITLTKTSADESKAHVAKDEKLAIRINKNISVDANEGSSPDDSQEYYPMTTSMTRELRLELEHLDRQVFGNSYVNRCSMVCDSPSESTSTEERPTNECTEIKQDCVANTLAPRVDTVELLENMKRSPLLDTVKSTARSAEDIYVWENPLHRNTPTTRTTASCPQTPDEQAELDFDGDTGEIFEEHSGKKSVTPIRLLRKNQSLEPQEQFKLLKDTHIPSSESDSSEKEPTQSKEVPKNGSQQDANATRSQKFFSNMSHELENAKKNCESLLNTKQPNLHSVASTINSFQKKYEALKPPVPRTASAGAAEGAGGAGGVAGLPPPGQLGGGNPFLMFLCLTVLLQHRDYIMRNRMDYNELAMHFDKMVRKHNVNRVLNQARQMYSMYLKQQAHKTGDVTT